MPHPFRILLAALALAIFTASSQAQTPTEILADAATKNGIDPKQAPAFHLKAHFDTFNEDGKPDGSGTFEEFSDGKDRIVTHATFRQAEYSVWHTPELFTAGQPFRQNFFQRVLLNAFTSPLPSPKALEEVDLKEKATQLGSLELDCIETARKPKPLPSGLIPQSPIPWLDEKNTYCISSEHHLLRASVAYPGLEFIYNQFQPFGGRQVPYVITLSLSKVLRGKLVVDSLEAWTPEDAAFAPTSSQAPQPEPIDISGAVIVGAALSRPQPKYPIWAKQRHIQGSVVLAATITPEGSVKDLQIVKSADPSLSQVAIETVETWRYKPYLLNGSPIAVHTMITVSFAFGS